MHAVCVQIIFRTQHKFIRTLADALTLTLHAINSFFFIRACLRLIDHVGYISYSLRNTHNPVYVF